MLMHCVCDALTCVVGVCARCAWQIPSAVGLLQSLVALDLSHNRLIGNLPVWQPSLAWVLSSFLSLVSQPGEYVFL